jgi:hypothetical protein
MATGWRGLPVVGKGATKTLEKILDGLGPDGEASSKTIDNKPGIYMAVHAEWIGRNAFGDLFSIAHYYEQHGDMMRDPDVVVVREFATPSDEPPIFYPVSFRQDSTGTFWEHLEFGEDRMPSRVSTKGMKDLASFMTTWMRNIKEQQGV